MELLNATRMVAGFNLGVEPSGRELLVVVAKGTFRIPPPDAPDGIVLHEAQLPLVMADTFTGAPGLSAPVYEVDFAPRKPRCVLCPWRDDCAAFKAGDAEDYPRKTPKAERPVLHAVAYWMTLPDGRVLLRRRKEEGLLGGMMEIPSSAWREKAPDEHEAARAAPAPATWRVLAGTVRHVFTHFELRLSVWAARSAKRPEADGVWCAVETLGDHALPTVMKKIVSHALAQLAKKSGPPPAAGRISSAGARGRGAGRQHSKNRRPAPQRDSDSDL